MQYPDLTAQPAAAALYETDIERPLPSSRLTDFLCGTCCAACAVLSAAVDFPFRNFGVALASAMAALILCFTLLRTQSMESRKRRCTAAGWMFLPLLILSWFLNAPLYERFSPKGGGPDLIADIADYIVIYLPLAVITLVIARICSAKYVKKQETAAHDMKPDARRAENRKHAWNVCLGLLGCLVLGLASYNVESFSIYLFLPLVLLCGILLPVISRRRRKTGKGGLFLVMLRTVCCGMLGFLAVCGILTQTYFADNKALYPIRRFSFLNGTVTMPGNRTMLPEALPAVNSDYFFYTKPYAHPLDGEPYFEAFLFLHTDDATIRDYEARLAEKGYTAEPNLVCTEQRLAELQEDYADASGEDLMCFQNLTQQFPTRIYRILTERGVLNEDLSHAVIYPDVLINKETNLLIIWTGKALNHETDDAQKPDACSTAAV